MPSKVPFNKAFVRRVAAELESDCLDRLDAIALRAHSRLVEATPVDTGQARAGWNFTLNERSEKVPARPAAGEKLPPPPSRPDRPARKLGDSYFISNFVKHIVFLNEGSSAKAPANFVEREIVSAVREFSK